MTSTALECTITNAGQLLFQIGVASGSRDSMMEQVMGLEYDVCRANDVCGLQRAHGGDRDYFFVS
jgi:hypothetical protein